MASAFAGALVCVLAAILASTGTPASGWVLAAAALYLVAVLVTLVVHVPLSDERLRAAGVGARAGRSRDRVTRWGG